MEETYERQLEDIAERMPGVPCIVALIPTIALDQAAALASDVAQGVSDRRAGHTILTTFEPSPARLDHEIGVEGGSGLTEVLGRRAELPGVAAHGRARGFIYLPAGAAAAPGESLLASDAWRALGTNAKAGGGTILAFVPPHIFEATMRSHVEGSAARFDAIVWLGPAPGEREGIRGAAIASGARDLGGIEPPGGRSDAGPETVEPPRAHPGSGTSDRPGPDAEGPDPRVSPEEMAAEAASARRSPAPRAQPVLIGPSRRRRKLHRRRRRTMGWIAAVLLGLLGATFVFLTRDRSDVPGPPGIEFAAPEER